LDRDVQKIYLILGMATIASFSAFAQPSGSQNPNPPPDSEKPVDNGPTTPGANNAYQGGGVTLQSQPGGPAPKPEATPAGQTPANMVPPK
jgi:hypothetical protein